MKTSVIVAASALLLAQTLAAEKYKDDCTQQDYMSAFGGAQTEVKDCTDKTDYDFASNTLPTGAQRQGICKCKSLIKKLPDVYFPRCNFALEGNTYTFKNAMASVFSDCSSDLPELKEVVKPSVSPSMSASGSGSGAAASKKPTAKPTPKPKKTPKPTKEERSMSSSGSGDDVGATKTKKPAKTSSGSSSLAIEKPKRTRAAATDSESASADKETTRTPAPSATKAPLKTTPAPTSAASSVAMGVVMSVAVTVASLVLA